MGATVPRAVLEPIMRIYFDSMAHPKRLSKRLSAETGRALHLSLSLHEGPRGRENHFSQLRTFPTIVLNSVLGNALSYLRGTTNPAAQDNPENRGDIQ
ncbi:hypothetical protein BZM27_47810 [Paraburkholderia steynii]|uniref:Uncharacterized protein n=1 Tax=Paraburkholderia steynii TaxID=1245441 RepID=A0A4R0X7Q8_9BURK|nr:hypothetical protein BZM27_47810 [Paraburkholderia steynii]